MTQGRFTPVLAKCLTCSYSSSAGDDASMPSFYCIKKSMAPEMQTKYGGEMFLGFVMLCIYAAYHLPYLRDSTGIIEMLDTRTPMLDNLCCFKSDTTNTERGGGKKCADNWTLLHVVCFYLVGACFPPSYRYVLYGTAWEVVEELIPYVVPNTYMRSYWCDVFFNAAGYGAGAVTRIVLKTF
jgi:hypothetical protein